MATLAVQKLWPASNPLLQAPVQKTTQLQTQCVTMASSESRATDTSSTSVKVARALRVAISDSGAGIQADVKTATVETMETIKKVACGLCAALTIATALPSFAASNQARLPPLSRDPERCQKAFVGNTIGQANGVADVLLDLRFCDYTNDQVNLKGKTLSAALMSDAKFDGADMTEVTMSKAYAVNASFKGTTFKNAILDRVVFDGADLRGTQFINTVLSGSTFTGANLENASFEDALIGYVDIQKLCRNPTLSEDSKGTLGCK